MHLFCNAHLLTGPKQCFVVCALLAHNLDSISLC